MNIIDIKRYYRFLRHKKETEIRAIIPGTKKVSSIFCHSEDEFVNACKKYNIYAGINERSAGGTEDDDVSFINNIGHDVDCHSSNSDMKVAKRVCEKYKQDCVDNGLEEPLVYFSGGGYWILHHPAPIENTPENREKIKIFASCSKKLYEEPGIDFDTKVYNPSRIARVPGTTNISHPENICDAYIVNDPSGEPDKKFRDQIHSTKLPEFDGTTIAEIPKGSCVFMNYCMAHKLPVGERHSIISRNLSLYIFNRPDKEKLKQQYVMVQEGRRGELDTWLNSIEKHPKKKYPFSCGELIKYQFKNNIPFQCEGCSLYKSKLEEVKGWANSISIIQFAKRYNFMDCPTCNNEFKFKDSHGLYYCEKCKYGGGLNKFAKLINKTEVQNESRK